MTRPHDPAGRTAVQDAAACVLARYPASLDRTELLARICRDEGIEVLDADLWDIRGVLRHEPEGWRLYLSRQDAPQRRLLTLAHLLGHYFLHAETDGPFIKGPVLGDWHPILP